MLNKCLKSVWVTADVKNNSELVDLRIEIYYDAFYS